MSKTRVRLVEEIFQTAYGLAPDERGAFLDERCHGDAELRREVEALLSHEAEADEAFLTGREAERTPSGPLSPGQRVGRFEIVSQIGEGGMGIVYEARQDHPRRTVALKLIRSERANPEILRRFRNEADVLAGLQHPGIAQIYEVGSARMEDHRGRPIEQPFFAMEIVRGESLHEHVRGRTLGLRATVKLVARVCDAVQHAHQRGFIHRDLKPDNILVVEADHEPGTDERPSPEFQGVGQPKILDFGIARATGPDAPRTTLETRFGHLVGTLEYMSPEQVAGDPHAVDTRSDVYALGVLLFELLVGRPPLDLGDAPLLECARRIREDAPASLRSVDASIPTEIEAVCGKALEKDAKDRYPSAGELAADLRRFLRGEAVLARSHSTFYVLRKSLRRHRTAALVTAVLVGLLAAFGVVSSMQAERLAVELRAGNIERGRVMARAHRIIPAENLIWKEHLADPRSRHSFWALWEVYAGNPCLGTWSDFEGRMIAAAFHPEGRLFATGSHDGHVYLWDAGGRGLQADLVIGHQVNSLDFHPDGHELAVASGDGRISIWDVAGRRIVRAIDAHVGAARAVAFVPDRSALVSGGDDGDVAVWDPVSGAFRRRMPAHHGALYQIAFSNDGAVMATGGDGDWILVWRGLDEPPAVRIRHGQDQVSALAFSHDGRTLASGGRDKRIRLWNTEDGRSLDTLEAPNGSVRFLAFPSSANDVLVSAGWWWTLIWDLKTGDSRPFLPGFESGAAFQLDDGLFATGHMALVRLWDLSTRGRVRLEGHTGRVVATLRPDGRVLATGDEAGVVRTWEAASGRLLSNRPTHDGRIKSIAFHPDGRLLAVGCEPGALKLVDLESSAVVLELGEHNATVGGVAFGPAGELVAYTCEDGMVRVVEVRTGALVHELEVSDVEAVGIVFAPDGRMAATARDHFVRLWSPEGELLFDLPCPSTPWTPVFSDDGTRLAVGSWGNAIHVWDLRTRVLEASLTDHRAVVWDVAFAPGDRNTLASASDDGTVKLWDLTEMRCLATLDDFDGWDIFTVDFGATGDVIVAGGRKAAMVWDLTYYERHMAGNLQRQLERLGSEVGRADRRYLTEWAERVLARPWPRFSPVPRGDR